MEKLKFYLRRIKTASPREVIYRLRERLFVFWLKFWGGRPKPQLWLKQECTRRKISIQFPDIKDEGRRICLNSQNIPSVDTFEKENRNVFFASIKVLNEPDIRMVWEKGRLQGITENLFSEKLEKAKDELMKWLSYNQFPFGPHYMSSMECALRIPVFIYSLSKIGTFSVDQIQQICKAIYEHAWLVRRRLSLFSSLGNHTVAEATGLIFAGGFFNDTSHGKEWLEKGIYLLESELCHQILNDGGPAEQSLNYHRLVLDLYWLAVDFLEKNKLYDCSRWKERLIAGEKFYKAFELAGEIPSIGDSDDGRAVAPGLAPKRVIPDVTFERFITFEESGYTIIRPVEDLFICFDHGPLGMPPLFGHGHADALSVVVSKGGLIFLCDPGTFRYNGVPEWRKYFKGTRAHNTVTIDGESQAVYETGFIWSKPYHCEVLSRREIGSGFYIVARQDGYKRLKNPVVHTRTVFCCNDGVVLIEDTFQGKGEHVFEVNYHLHPEVILEREGEWYLLRRENQRLFLRVPGVRMDVIHGQMSPTIGWVSRKYGSIEPSLVVQGKIQAQVDGLRLKSFISVRRLDDSDLLALVRKVADLKSL